jgi:hypothetical protein
MPRTESIDSGHEWKKWSEHNTFLATVRGQAYWGHTPDIAESCSKPAGLQVPLINGLAQLDDSSSSHILSDYVDSNKIHKTVLKHAANLTRLNAAHFWHGRTTEQKTGLAERPWTFSTVNVQ